MNNKNKQSFILKSPIYIRSFASIAGKKEGDGPLGKFFDIVEKDSYFGEKTWEKAESTMQQRTLSLALEKINKNPSELSAVLAGDLNNQCIASAYGMRKFKIPYIGIYGACSNMAQGLCIASLILNSEQTDDLAVVTSSHYSTAEKQFRYPLCYGGQRDLSAQWTTTACGAVILSTQKAENPWIYGCCIGKICDMGISDLSNMGAAMAPAAADTISSYLYDTNQKVSDFDAIVTGDLGYIGSELLCELLLKDNLNIRGIHCDCGKMIFNQETQDTHSGGSGCGCSASVLCGYFLKMLKENKMKNILFAATGALMSPVSVNQGETIPGICHLVQIKI
jgi:stage V sporulation protein AD